ncbi:MAG: hypothetical protein KDE28_29975, partial [Anaerolineales bacterium]|nr:hypothetical protein [Anaerolineales bacterium]
QSVAGTESPDNVNVFNYAPERQVESGENRPVLTTGSFSSTDTQISLSSELGTILSQPLPEPRSNAEGEAEERFVTVLLRNFEGQLAGNAELRNELRQTLLAQGVPEIAIKPLLGLPIATLYSWTRLPPFVPDSLRIPVKRVIRNTLSTAVLQPLGQQLQASALDARIESSTQANVLREHQRLGTGQFSDAEKKEMQLRANNGGPSDKAQKQQKQAGANRHNTVLQHTPEAIVAGPSHSQIAKDHANSPFFGLAFKLAAEAVRRLRVQVMAAWAEGGSSAPFSFEQENYPAGPQKNQNVETNRIATENQALFHEARPERLAEVTESSKHGQAILSQGGAQAQPYQLVEIRTRDAAELRQTAIVLSALA